MNEQDRTVKSESKPNLLGAAHPPRRKKFRELFCDEFGCSREDYVRKAFSEGLFSHARIPAMIIQLVSPKFFGMDREYIIEAGETEDPLMFRGEIDIYHGNNLRSRSWLRNKLRIRLSGTRMKRLGERLFNTKMR